MTCKWQPHSLDAERAGLAGISLGALGTTGTHEAWGATHPSIALGAALASRADGASVALVTGGALYALLAGGPGDASAAIVTLVTISADASGSVFGFAKEIEEAIQDVV